MAERKTSSTSRSKTSSTSRSRKLTEPAQSQGLPDPEDDKRSLNHPRGQDDVDHSHSEAAAFGVPGQASDSVVNSVPDPHGGKPPADGNQQSRREGNPKGVPVMVTNYTQRHENDAIEGLFVDIVGGDYIGRRGKYEKTSSYSNKDGYPEKILVRTRDAENMLIEVSYSDVKPAREYSGGR